MRLAVVSLVCLFAACFQDQPADRVWRCSVDQPQCPEGQSCIDNWCIKDGTAMPDLSVIDGGGDMTIPKPCQDGFPLGSQGVWACRGAFSPASPASSLCKLGYKVCTDGNKITDAECSSIAIKGFFFSALPAQGNTGKFARCVASPPGLGAGAMWFGCGWHQGTFGQPTERTDFPCAGFPLITYCNTANQFVCNQSDLRLDAQTMSDARSGVLCCPP